MTTLEPRRVSEGETKSTFNDEVRGQHGWTIVSYR